MSIFDKLITIDKNSTNLLGLTKELKCLYIFQYLKEQKGNILLVTNSLYEATNYYQILLNYTKDVLLFPMDDFLTSEALAISPELKTTRLETINDIINSNNKIIVTNLMGYLRFLPTKETYINSKITLKVGEDYHYDTLVHQLYQNGYIKEATVNKTGEMSVHGFVIDIFPLTMDNPVRVELWGDTIESIRLFNVDNQLTIEKINQIEIYPNTELLLNQNIDTFDMKHRDIIKYGKATSIKNYLNDVTIFFDDYSQLESSYQMLLEEMMEYSISLDLPANTIYMNDFYQEKNDNSFYFSPFDNDLKNKSSINYNSLELTNFQTSTSAINKQLNEYFKKYSQVVICVNNRYKANKIIDELKNPLLVLTNENELVHDKINIIIKNVSSGFIINQTVVITEREIFNQKNSNHIYKSNFKMGTKIRDITKLNIGDFVVHNIHGIGRYCGIKTITKNGLKKDYLHVEYKDNDKLYIPVEKIELISKYSSKDAMAPKINKLGSVEWEKTKLRAKKRIQDMAEELLKLYAEREASVGYSFNSDTEDQLQFEKEFEYQPTIDQLKAIEDIKKDMEKSSPMDRLLCGDVGYGKTEVAFRAIFKAIIDGKQVALLCPTTILSNQHYQNAINRFKAFPINIAIMNRFVSTRQIRENLTKLKEGKIDLLIGTHRLLSDDVKFKDLGLLIIDEEQRFGVKHKEKIKQYKNSIDVLTLSATPIPRTLQMSMAGIRALSLIETPPNNRYPVQTYVLNENNQIIKDAIYKELSRDGQIFILYNKVEDMNVKALEISRLVPDARVIYAHGQMSKTELEDVMIKFIKREYDVLLCTTIIETGIDIPSVNTLIIFDADNFGLSQLYQIRGRVGRSNKIAYCYLMYNKNKILSEIATKRLQAIKEFTELGSGFAIAMRDLSIRGAGDILGSEQAGFIDTIGIELFMEMLNNEIKILKGEKIKEATTENQALIDVETTIDDKYISNEEIKIEIHKKINNISTYEELIETKTELEDRFGKLSDQLLIYMHEELFENMAESLNINQVRQTKSFIEITISKELSANIDGQILFFEVNSISKMFRFSMKNNRIIITLDTIKLETHFIYYLVKLMEVLKKSIKEN